MVSKNPIELRKAACFYVLFGLDHDVKVDLFGLLWNEFRTTINHPNIKIEITSFKILVFHSWSNLWTSKYRNANSREEVKIYLNVNSKVCLKNKLNNFPLSGQMLEAMWKWVYVTSLLFKYYNTCSFLSYKTNSKGNWMRTSKA